MAKKTARDLGLVFNPDGYEGEILHSVAIYDQSDFLQELLDSGVQGCVKSTDNFGRTALHTAASHGSTNCVKLLLKRGADPNAISGIEDKCFTPVHHAAHKGHWNSLAALLEYEVNMDIKNSGGKRALDLALEEKSNNHTKCVDMINKFKEQKEKEREDAKCEDLYDVVNNGLFERSKQILESISDPYAIVNLHYHGPYTLLYRASIGGYLDIVKLLIDYNADGRANFDSGLTPLYGACFAGHLDVVIHLSTVFPHQLEIPVTSDCMYPFHAAIIKGHTEIVCYLITLRRTEKKETGKKGERESCGYQVDINKSMQEDGYTPLHLAVLYSKVEIVKALLSCGPVMKTNECIPPGSLLIDKPANKKTAFHHALFLGKVEIAELLLNNGSNIEQEFDDGEANYTPFVYACAFSSEKMVNILIKTGAVDKDHIGLGMAIDKDRENIVHILLKNGVWEDEDGKVVVAASEVSLAAKPVFINWSYRNLKFVTEGWIFHAGYSCNMHIEQKLSNDPGLRLKIFTSINLSNNKLENLPPVLFQLPSLKYLNLAHNKLKSLPGTSDLGIEPMLFSDNWNCPSLEELELQDNVLTLPPKVLFTMPLLQSINLGYNKINVLPFDMWIAPRLKSLILEHNCLTELPCFSDGSGKKPIHNIGKEFRSKSMSERSQDLGGEDDDFALTSQVFSKRPTWDGNSDDEEDEDVDYLNKSGLNKLDLSNNQFTSVPIGLPCLAPNLSKLILKNNKVTIVDSITIFPDSLTTLDLSENGLKKFDLSQPKPEELNLCYAIVRRNLNSSSRPLSFPSLKQKFCLHCRHRQLTNLSRLILSTNLLDKLPLTQPIIKGCTDNNQKILFPDLKTLDMSKNKLSKVPLFIGKLSRICSLSLEQNSSIDVLPSELGLCSELYELKIDYQNIKDPPRNILDKQTHDGRMDVRFLTGYLRSLHEKAQIYPNIKLMVVGLHGIGKTSLLNCLRREGSGTFQKPEYKNTFSERRMNEKLQKSNSLQSTVGVDICDWQYQKKVRGLAVKFSTWDFGGQTEYYATHQCFLSRRALYLLIWRLTDGVEGVEKMKHWLLNIQERAPNSSVIIVGTFLDEALKKHNKDFVAKMNKEIRDKYVVGGNGWKPAERGLPNVVSIIEVSCKAETNIGKLRELIYDTVVNLKAEGKEANTNLLDKKIPASYIAVEKAVSAISESLKNEMPVLEENQFRLQVFKHLKTQGVDLRNGNEELDQAVEFLHDYGIMLHYDDPALRDLYFVDPQWLCDMLAHVVTVRCVNPFIVNGVLKISDLQNQIFHGEKRFPSSMVMKYVELMSKFEVAIKISNKFLLIPSLLPDKQKECTVVCDVESTELRKAMNIHAYLNHDVYRRQYLMSYTPSGFWPRLLARLIADDRICKIVSSCCVIQGCGDLGSEQARIDSEALMRAAPPEWACWKTGIELSCFGTKLLRVCQLDPDEPFYGGKETGMQTFVKSINSDGLQKMVAVEILAPNVALHIEKFIQFSEKADGNGENLVVFRVIGISEDSTKTACQLLVITIEHIDSLFAEWFPKIDCYTNIHGNKAVQRVSFCNECLHQALGKVGKAETSEVHQTELFTSSRKEVVPDHEKEQMVYTAYRSHAASIAESLDNLSILDEEDATDGSDTESVSSEIYNDIEGITEEEKALLLEYREMAHGCIIAFELEEASKLLRKNLPLVCPFHYSVSMEKIFPDLAFKDLDNKYIIRPSQITQGVFLADGAFGDIFKTELYLNDEVYHAAMKIPKEKEKEVMATLFSYNTYKSIRQEIAILMPIKHPHIIDFLGISLSPFAMLLELAPCGSLDRCYHKYRNKGKKLNPNVIQKVLQQVSHGLKYLHRHHIIYRDLKCENVLVWSFPDENVSDGSNKVMLKLTDYGISRSVSLSGTKGYHGTPGYMAPEILRYTGKESYTCKVDCFSFGSLMYELIALKQPFRELAKNKASLAQQFMLEGKRPKLTSSEKKFPILMLSLLYRCWAQNPEDRPTANEINNLVSLEEFPKVIDVLGLDESFKFQCAVTTNQTKCLHDLADSRNLVGSHLWYCGFLEPCDSYHKQGIVMVSSYHENKYSHVTNIQINDRILMACAVGSTIWLGTESGSIQVFCTLQFKPLAIGEAHRGRYILRIIHSTATHSVFVALDDGSVYGYHDNLINYSEIIPEESALRYFPFSLGSIELRKLVHNMRFTSDTEMHCLVGVSSNVRTLDTEQDIIDEKDDEKKSYELWCGQGKGTILILDMNTLKKVSTLAVNGSFISDPSIRALKVTFMETSRTYDAVLNSTVAPDHSERETISNDTQYIWLVVYPGTEVARWNVDERCVINKYDTSLYLPQRDFNSAKASSKTKALKASNAQISALVIVENTMFVGTRFGCLFICNATSMTLRLSLRCYEECIESIIPLRMIAGRNREDSEKKLVITSGKKCFDGWIRPMNMKRRRGDFNKSDSTLLTWNSLSI